MKRRRVEEAENHERWLVSYADFITLLFAFFVVMYAISSVNEGKYKLLSESLQGVFSESAGGSTLTRTGVGIAPQPIVPIADPFQTEPADPLEVIEQAVQKQFGDLLESSRLNLRGNEMWLEIELSSSLIFPSGDAIPTDMAFQLLEQLAGILAPYKNPVRVEGYTDNRPIRTLLYPSNWELSAARAASVARILAGSGVDPARLSVVGYGEHQPLEDNSTPQGRARNRRVVLAVSRHIEAKAGSGSVSVRSRQAGSGTASAGRSETAEPGAGSVNPVTRP